MRIQAAVLLLPLLGASLLLNGCIYVGDWGDNMSSVHEDFHSTHPLSAGGTVTVESFNGSVDITGWEQNSVEINGTKYGNSKSAVDQMKIDVNANPNSIRVRATRPSEFQWHNGGGVRFAIRVPHKVILDLISTSNGKIQVEDIEGTVHLRSSNGAIRISRVKGDVEAGTSNGTIEAQDLDGTTRFHTNNGSIRAESNRGSFEGVTSNGSITARLHDPSGSSPVRAETSNGHIELTFDSKTLPKVRAGTSNSSIVIRVPASANARVRASTSHSSITSDFDELSTDRGRRHSEVDGTIGRGGPLLDLHSSNGAIKIMKL